MICSTVIVKRGRGRPRKVQVNVDIAALKKVDTPSSTEVESSTMSAASITTLTISDTLSVPTTAVPTTAVPMTAVPMAAVPMAAVDIQQSNRAQSLSSRENWQSIANNRGADLETVVEIVIREFLNEKYPGQFIVKKKPTDLQQIYLEEARIKNPFKYDKSAVPKLGETWYDEATTSFVTQSKTIPKKATGGGCIPDMLIRHKTTKKAYLMEIKSQGADGNAQERAAKFATPSILAAIQRKLGVAYHPIGYLFSGEMVMKEKYILELEATYGFAHEHLMLWKPSRQVDVLCEWVDRIIVPLLV